MNKRERTIATIVGVAVGLTITAVIWAQIASSGFGG